MNHFELFAHGPSFDPDAFLAVTTLQFDGSWRRGERDGRHPASSGVRKVLGDGRTLPTHEQERIAIEYNIVLEEGLVGFCVGASAALMSHALDIGIEPTFYVTLDRPSS